MAIGWLYVGLGMMPLTQLFTGLGDTKLVTKLNIITIIIGIPIAYIIIPIYGVVGRIITGLIVPWPTFFYAIRKGKEKYGVKIPLKQVTRVYMTSIFSTIPIIALTMLNLDYLVTLVLGGVIGVCLYLFLAPKLRAIDRDDIAMLASTLGTLPILSKLIVKILSLEEKLL
jgi:O-antigen/teichoic acid export membrane protein